MDLDMSQFHQAFFEETDEHLASMESLLLELDLAQPDSEALNAIFRAAHSIKGSSGTFGFDDLAQVTHLLEDLLDRVRQQEIRLDHAMIETFLDAGDVLKKLLAAHRGQSEADPAAIGHICSRLAALVPQPEAHAAQTLAPLAITGPYLDISFILDDSNNIAITEALFEEFARYGEVHIRVRGTAANPVWVLALAGENIDIHEIRSGLEFVASSGSIRINVGGENTAAAGDERFFDSLASLSPLAATAPGPSFDAGGQAWSAPVGGESIRVGIDKVDQLINLVGELVITQSMLHQAAGLVDSSAGERLQMGLGQLERHMRDLQHTVLSIRMVPVSLVFSRFPRVVHDLSHKLGKQVQLQLVGEATELDKGLIERISDPLTHLVRNSLDHGIEMPALREAIGKPRSGTITLKAYHQGGNVVIEVADDGAGLDRQRILAKARASGLPADEAMSDEEVWPLIFEPGFSTAAQVTEVSGRGVGMDVVKRNITALGGRVDIQSTAGLGSCMQVRLPLTLAILDGMSVAVGQQTYIVPLSGIGESLQAQPAMLECAAGSRCYLQLREARLPVIALHEVFAVPGVPPALTQGIMVVVEADGQKAALFVDALLGQGPVVIKSLEANFRKVAGVSGTTIMGDGRVALILDLPALVALAHSPIPAVA